MSILLTMTVNCPKCEAAFEADVFESINADRRPDLRDQIVDGTLQVVNCPDCSEEFRIDPLFNYLDSGQRQWVSVQPVSVLNNWRSEEDRASVVFDQAYGSKAPASAREIGEALDVRLVFGWPALVEKLLLRENNLDDVIVELAKLALMQGRTGTQLADGNEFRVIGVGSEDLTFAWVSATSGATVEAFSVPRDLIDGIAEDLEPWSDIRDTLSDGPFVDVQKLFVGDDLEATTQVVA